MRNANIIGMSVYILGWGFAFSLFTENYDLMRQLGGLTFGGYLLFIIIENYEQNEN